MFKGKHIVGGIVFTNTFSSSYFSTKKKNYIYIYISCGYSLEVPCQGNSNMYLQSMFLWTNEKNMNIFWLEKAFYLEL